MGALARLLLLIEAFVCFGPLLFLLCLGLVVAPFWVIGLTLDPEITRDPAWDVLHPLLLVLFGIIGTVALICVVLEIVSGKQWLSARIRNALFAPGLLAVLMLNWPWVPTLLTGEMTSEAIWPLLIYFVLPVAGSIHLLWLSSRRALTIKRELNSQ